MNKTLATFPVPLLYAPIKYGHTKLLPSDWYNHLGSKMSPEKSIESHKKPKSSDRVELARILITIEHDSL